MVDGGLETATADALRETLKTGLFTAAAGLESRQWSHKSYAEYLAARYLTSRNLTPAQMTSLLVQSAEPEHKVVPQLRQIASRLCSLVPKVREALILSDPETVLLGDASEWSNDERSEISTALILAAKNLALRPNDWDLFSRLAKLSWSGMAEQLRPILCDGSIDLNVRLLAVRMADACQVKSLHRELVELAVGKTTPYQLRYDAVHALVNSGSREDVLRLRPIAEGNTGEDPDDELKGCALEALWPTHLGWGEVAPMLTDPQQSDNFGTYSRFISNISTKVSVEDLPACIKWANHHDQAKPYEWLHNCAKGLILRGWQELEASGVRESVADAIVARLNADHELRLDAASVNGNDTPQIWKESQSRRRQLLKEIASNVTEIGQTVTAIRWHLPEIFFEEDLPFMLNELRSACDAAKNVWAEWIKILFMRWIYNGQCQLAHARETLLKSKSWERDGMFRHPVEIGNLSPNAVSVRGDRDERSFHRHTRRETRLRICLNTGTA